MPDSKPPLGSLKTGAFARGLSLARMSVSAGMRVARFNVENWIGDDDQRGERLKTLLDEQAGAVVRELGLLKGSAMKVGQMLSMVGGGILPEKAIALLKTLQSDSPPLAWTAIERVLRAELPAEQLAQLDIDPVPVASASLGQVHKAIRRSDGQRLALKVQYPGVDKAIDSDLRVIRRLLGLARLLPGDVRTDEIFDELRGMMHQELDYNRERMMTDKHRAYVVDDPRLIVPRTFPEFSSAHVLATSFEDGWAVDGPEVAQLSQERRDALGMAALEVTLRELTQWRSMQTDPHFGNYRIRPASPGYPDRIVMLDFGAVRSFDDGPFLSRYLNLGRAATAGNAAKIQEAAGQLGLLLADDPPAVRATMTRLALLIVEPLGPPRSDNRSGFTEDGSYRWGANDLPRRAMLLGKELVFSAKPRVPPREMLFLDRKLSGMFFFLATLKAVVQARPIVEHYLGLSNTESDNAIPNPPIRRDDGSA